jgi:ectoine hydroxylase-related dioxygenase (phytanoyl-CoA dioxygenase family)
MRESSWMQAGSGSVDRFHTDGATVLRGLLEPHWIETLRVGVERNRSLPSAWSHWYTNPDEPVGFWTDYVTWRHVPEYERIVFDSGLAEVAAQLMGSRTARFFHEHVLVKEPGATERTPWHHDQPYYCVDGDQNVSTWVPLDPVPRTSGVRFVAGSHRWDQWFVPRRFIDHSAYADASGRFELVPDVDELVERHPDRYRLLAWDVEPGDVVAFHYRTLHGAPGNELTTRRRAVSLRWLGDDATYAERPWEVSPPYEADGLVPGGSLGDDPRFPVVPT